MYRRVVVVVAVVFTYKEPLGAEAVGTPEPDFKCMSNASIVGIIYSPYVYRRGP